MIMKDKRARGLVTTIFTAGLILGIIYFIVFVIWGASGGFSAISQVGKLMSKIPAWFYIIVALIWLSKSMFGGGGDGGRRR